MPRWRRRGDFFYMMRTGDDKAGIVFCGQFLSDPYPADDWAGSTKRRMYVDMICYNAESGSAYANKNGTTGKGSPIVMNGGCRTYYFFFLRLNREP